MQTPLQITFHNLPHSKVIESAIQEAADRLRTLMTGSQAVA